jgi:hypothetical protein
MQGDIAPPQLPRVKMDRAYFTRKFTPMTDDEFKQEIAAHALQHAAAGHHKSGVAL